jgi:guanylate kinase
MKKKTILIDVDGVLTETMDKTIKRYNNKYNKSIKVSDIKDYTLHKNKDIDKDIYNIFKEKEFFKNLKPNEEAVKIISKLFNEGHDIIFSTAVVREGYIDRHDWLKKHFPIVPDKNYMLGCRKDLLKGDIMLDDSPDNLLNSRCKHVVCMDRPWNKHLKNIKRVSSFFEFYNWIKILDKDIFQEFYQKKDTF